MYHYFIIVLAIGLNFSASAQTIESDIDSLPYIPRKQIGLTIGRSGYQMTAIATYKIAHMKSSIATVAGFNMGYWYFGLGLAKNFEDAARSEYKLIESYDSLTIYRAYTEFEKYYGLQFGRSREVRSCERTNFSGFQFSFDYYAFLSYGERSHRYQNEYLTLGTPSTTWWAVNNVPQTVEFGERKVSSLNTGIGLMLGLDMVFGSGNRNIGEKRNIIVGFKFGIPNIGVDIPLGQKSISDPLNVFTSPTDKTSLTFYHQALLKVGYCF